MVHIVEALVIALVCLLAWRLVERPGARRIWAVFGIASVAQAVVWFLLQLRWSTPGADVSLWAWILGALFDGALMGIAIAAAALVAEHLASRSA
jgi:hypothetical protein